MTGYACMSQTYALNSSASACTTCTYSWSVTSVQGDTVVGGGGSNDPNIQVNFNHDFIGVSYAQVGCTYNDPTGTFCSGGFPTDIADLTIFGNRQLTDPVLLNGPYDGDTSKTWIYVRLRQFPIQFFDYSSRTYSVQGGTLDSVTINPNAFNAIEEDTLYIRWNNVANRQINCGGSVTGTQSFANPWPNTCSNYVESIPPETLNPAIPIGPNLLCPGDTGVYYTTPVATATYTWTVSGGTILNGQGTPQVQVVWNSIPGTLTVSRDIGGSISSNTLTLGSNAAPINPNPLVADTSFCAGTPLVLDAGGADGWLWSTGDTTQSIAVNDSGSYQVEVTHIACGTTTTIYDTIVVQRNLPIVPDLGPDSTFCDTNPYVLTVGAGFSGIFWLNSTVSADSFTTFTGGTYYVNTTDTNGCQATDTVLLTHLSPPSLSLPNFTSYCIGDSVQLDAGNAATHFLWSTGDTTQAIYVSTPGQYSVEGWVNTACPGSDTVNVITLPLPVVNLVADSTFCSGDSVLLDAGNPGGSYIWSTGATTQTVTINSTGLIAVTVTAQVCTASDSINMIELTDCVWPGDCNNDGVTNNTDVLALGTVFAQVGPTRPNASLSWTGQEATDWATNVTPTANTKHCDTDGNGVNNADDTLAILLNFGLTHNKTNSVNAANNLYLVAETDSALAGDTVYFQVVLGDVQNPVDSVYGLAYIVNYDTSLLDPIGLPFVDYSSSMLGGSNQLLTFSRDFPGLALADLVVSRTTLTDTVGYGAIARLGFILTSNLNGATSRVFNVSLSDLQLVNHQLIPQSIGAGFDSVIVFQESPLALDDRWSDAQLELRPNPANEVVALSILHHRIVSWEIFDLQGGLKAAESGLDQEMLMVNTSGLAEGVYLIRVQDEGGRVQTKKLIKSND